MSQDPCDGLGEKMRRKVLGLKKHRKKDEDS